MQRRDWAPVLASKLGLVELMVCRVVLAFAVVVIMLNREQIVNKQQEPAALLLLS